jgi:hypothetical protein
MASSSHDCIAEKTAVSKFEMRGCAAAEEEIARTSSERRKWIRTLGDVGLD